MIVKSIFRAMQMRFAQIGLDSALMRYSVRYSVLMGVLMGSLVVPQACDSGPERSALQTANERTAARTQAAFDRLTEQLAENPDSIRLLSQRGDILFEAARFSEAVQDYDRMIELDPSLDNSHWRRGIAYFYARQFEKAASQFERYHSFDQIDRENGIWRYLSQVKAYGREKARAGLLTYEKDDREPFPDVYRLFAGTTTPEEILRKIQDAALDENEREKRLFYAHLYIGLNEAVENRPGNALKHLELSVQNRWAPVAGYGPRYMWHVGRLHANILTEAEGRQQKE